MGWMLHEHPEQSEQSELDAAKLHSEWLGCKLSRHMLCRTAQMRAICNCVISELKRTGIDFYSYTQY